MKKIFNIIKFGIGFLATIIFFEIYLSATELSLTSNQIDQFRLKPGSLLFETKEGLHLGKINDYGYIGPSYPPKKPRNTIRIALLGDSFVEGFQLFDRHHFRNLIEKKLKEKINKNVEILNFGRSGFDFFSMYAYYKEFATKFSPDIVLFFVGEQDFYENSSQWVDLNSINKMPEITIKQENLSAQSWTNNLFKGRFVLPPLIYKCSVLIRANQTQNILFGNYALVSDSEGSEKSSTLNEPEINHFLIDQIMRDLGLKSDHYSKPFIFFVIYEDLSRQLDLEFNSNYKFVFDLNTELKLQESAGHNLNYWKATMKTGHWNHEGHKVIADFLTDKLLDQYLNNINEF